MLGTHRAVLAALLHVDIVVVVVPHALDAQEVLAVGGVAVPTQRVDEEVFLNVPVARQHQDPAVDPQTSQGVNRWLFTFLGSRKERS